MAKQVTYKIKEIGEPEISLAARDIDYSIEPEQCEVILTLTVHFDPPNEQTDIILRIQYQDKRDNSLVMEFTNKCSFTVLEFKKVFNWTDSGRMEIPDNFMLEVIIITIGVARGSLSILNRGTFLEKIILPVFRANAILDQIKAAHGIITPKTV